MRHLKTRLIAIIAAGALIGSLMLSEAQAVGAFKVLVFSKTTDGTTRHASIPDAISAIQALGAANNFDVVATEDATVFNDTNLAEYKVVVFALTNGDPLNATQQSAFERYIKAGGGFVGVHSASDTEKTWPFYMGLVGAEFSTRPTGTLRLQNATVKVLDKSHPSTATLPRRWGRHDEWYNFKLSPRGKVHVLATLDETTYAGGAHGLDHPIAWCQGYSGGRSWYTAGGDTPESWADTTFRTHVLGGILYSAQGDAKRDCGGTVDKNINRVTLDDAIDQPMSLQVAADGRVFFIERTGKVKIYKPDTNATVVAGTITTHYSYDHGLHGIALDPAFASNNTLYLYYTLAPAGVGASPTTRVSRFRMNGDVLDMSSEKILSLASDATKTLTITVTNDCCHQGGSLAVGPDGSLYLYTRDDSTASGSQGYAPFDETPTGKHNDAQRSSANTKDLRGKILRIVPDPVAGTYTIPAGNLFTSATDGYPEIYVMGLRNPFRISLDQETGWLYWGDVGPDANADDPERGPMGRDELNRAKAPGNYGWPYCLADNKPYIDHDFATGVSKGVPFNCSVSGTITNDSPRNTGKAVLPPAQPALMWYAPFAAPSWPEMGSGCRTAEAGPVYHYDPNLVSDRKLPAYYDDTLFIYDWCRGWIKEVKLDENSEVLKITPFLAAQPFGNPIDMELGPDGALYVLDFGPQAGAGSYFSEPNSGYLVRVEYSINGRTPVAKADKTAPTAGKAPLTVNFDATGSHDLDAEDLISYAWDFTGDGVTDSTSLKATHTYPVGDFMAKLTVSDQTGKSASVSVPIYSGNEPPTITFRTPNDGQVIRMGETILFSVNVTDPEDGNSDDPFMSADICSRVVITPSMGHNEHSHGLTEMRGCSGEITTPAGHDAGAYSFIIINASYSDKGGGGVSPLTRNQSIVLQPDRLEAEGYRGSFGVSKAASKDGDSLNHGSQSVYEINNNDWIMFPRISLTGVHSIGFRVSSWYFGGRIEVHAGSPIGPLLATAQVPHTTHPTIYVEAVAPVVDQTAGAANDLYFVFKRWTHDVSLLQTCATAKVDCINGSGELDGAWGLFNLNWIDFLTHREPRILP